MNHSRRLPLVFGLGFGLGLLARLAFVHGELPERVASHFDLAGRPDDYQSRLQFVLTAGLLDVMLLILFLALPALIARTPVRMVNLPNKEYWFAPERRALTEGRLTVWVSWFSCATLGLLCGLFELIIRANLRGGPLGYQLWLMLASYLLFMLFGSAGLAHAFRRP
jgi:uncharacterized membrane protein